jgi:hypothetical protein
MREEPIRPLPPPAPPPALIEVRPEPPKSDSAVAEIPAPQPRKAPEPEYVFHCQFAHAKTGEIRNEQLVLSPDEIAECFLDGIGPTGARGRELALRIAGSRVPPEYIFKPETLHFDMGRLVQSLDKDR